MVKEKSYQRTLRIPYIVDCSLLPRANVMLNSTFSLYFLFISNKLYKDVSVKALPVVCHGN